MEKIWDSEIIEILSKYEIERTRYGREMEDIWKIYKREMEEIWETNGREVRERRKKDCREGEVKIKGNISET